MLKILHQSTMGIGELLNKMFEDGSDLSKACVDQLVIQKIDYPGPGHNTFSALRPNLKDSNGPPQFMSLQNIVTIEFPHGDNNGMSLAQELQTKIQEKIRNCLVITREEVYGRHVLSPFVLKS